MIDKIHYNIKQQIPHHPNQISNTGSKLPLTVETGLSAQNGQNIQVYNPLKTDNQINQDYFY